ncbi:hypothetical protein Y032_0280g1213 [Ancylostoma ceylanicum]|uniref:Uncharacterized protein n=3 Tax=Ancylostoma ceylanicum TaxID=53326 RepID=A0A016S7M0_9BILA|nr:hypothetical protein Y032_0280g1213 [Ancylostoma ceylanicum]
MSPVSFSINPMVRTCELRRFGALESPISDLLASVDQAANISSKDGSRKLEEFMRNLKRDPEWARSIPFVKLNAMVPKDVQMELVAHAYLNVNARPKQLVVLTKCMDTADLTEHIKRAFEPTEVPMQKSLFRLYCRNATPNLRSLIRSILTATAATPGLEVEYTDVLGEVCYKGSKVRMKTSDIKRFCTLEDAGRSMGMRYLTTFNCRSTRNPHRVMDIRYYDEMKPDYSRVTYIHLDHEAFNHRPLRFSDVNVEIPFDVDTDHMTPLHQMYPHVYDLNEMIRKLHAQHSQQHSL